MTGRDDRCGAGFESEGKLPLACPHPCPKPLGWATGLIHRVASKCETILDPFMGSRTTGVAAVQMGKSFIGIEREPKYFEIACRRIEDAQRQGDFFVGAAA